MSKLLLMHVGSKSPDPHTTALPTNQKSNAVHPQSQYGQTEQCPEAVISLSGQVPISHKLMDNQSQPKYCLYNYKLNFQIQIPVQHS